MTEYWAKFYPNYFSSTPFEKQKVLNEISIVEDVTTFSQTTFGIDIDIVWLDEWQKVELIEVNNNIPEIIFEWVVSSLQFTLDRIFITAIDWKGFLKEKKYISTMRFHNDVSKIACPIWSAAYREYSVGNRILCLTGNSVSECVESAKDQHWMSVTYYFRFNSDRQDKYWFVYVTWIDDTYKYDWSTWALFKAWKWITLEQYFDHIVDLLNTDFYEGWSHDVDIQDIIEQTSLKWDVYYDAIWEVSSAYQRKVSNWKISVKPIYWEDRSTDLALKFDWSFSQWNNITEPRLETNKSFRNVVIQTDWETATIETNNDSVIERWGLCETIRWRLKNTQSAGDILNDLSSSKRVFSFDIIPWAIQWLNAGDKVPLVISNTHNYLNFSWDVYVVRKETTIRENTKSISYNVADVIVSRAGFKSSYTQVNSDLWLVKIA